MLTEGRYFKNPFDQGPGFFNPYDWDWEVIPQTEIAQDKLGVLISLVGEERARTVMEASNHYKWIYKTVLDETEKLGKVIRNNKRRTSEGIGRPGTSTFGFPFERYGLFLGLRLEEKQQ